MEEDQEHKHVCKLCNKSFPCGRSLGGHMRGHATMNSAERDEKLSNTNMGFEGGGHSNYGLRDNPKKKKAWRVADEKLKNSDIDFEESGDGGGHTNYGLREHPKKSWRFSDTNHGTPRQESVCKDCGKGFQSLRALSGHMRSHSQRGREECTCKECGKGFQSMRALFGHMRHHSGRVKVSNESWTSSTQSDIETAGPIRRKRSRTMRYKITANSSSSNLNVSSSVSEIEQELEDVAMCLMMLSRSVENWGGFNSITESSDNNSLIFEAKSSHQNRRIAENEGVNFVCHGGETLKMEKPVEKMLNSCVSDSGNALFVEKISEFGDFESGFASYEEKKVELEVPADGFLRGDESRKPKLDDESEVEFSDTKMEKEIKPTEVELGRDSMKGVGLDRADSEFMKSNSSKKARFDAYNPELGGNSCNKVIYTTSDSEVFEDSRKKGKYECRTCNKSFQSYQALGGHRVSHKTVKRCFVSKIESCGKSTQSSLFPDIKANCELVKFECNENSIEHEVGGTTGTSYQLKKSKGHECPICFKVFPSGQALGGHKRAHFIGLSETRAKQTIILKQEIHDIFDLNHPATLEEETSGHVGFKPWWVGSNHKHESLVGLISN